MSAAPHRPRTVSTELDSGLWKLRAGVIVGPDGSATLLLAKGARALEDMVSGLDEDPGYVGPRLVGIDRAGRVMPLSEAMEDAAGTSWGGRAGTATSCASRLRTDRIIVLRDVPAEASPPPSRPLDLTGVLGALVDGSTGLRDLVRPLRRMVDLVRRTSIVAFVVDSSVTLTDLRSAPTIRSSNLDARPEGPGPASPGDPRAHAERADATSSERSSYHAPVLDELILEDGRSAVLQSDGSTWRLRVLSHEETELWNRVGAGEILSDGSLEGQRDAMWSEGLLAAVPSWRISEDVAWVSDSDRTTVLGSAEDALPVALAGSSHVVWTVLVDRRVVRQDVLVEACAGVFVIDAHEIAGPIDALLGDLCERGLLVRI